MTPAEATLVQDAAGLVAAHLRSDGEAQDVLLEPYVTGEGFSPVVTTFVLYLSAAVQIRANLIEGSWLSVLEALPEHRVNLIPGIEPDWSSIRRLVAHVTDARHGEPTDMEVISCFEGAYGLAVSITSVLGKGDQDSALAWAAEISARAAQEN